MCFQLLPWGGCHCGFPRPTIGKARIKPRKPSPTKQFFFSNSSSFSVVMFYRNESRRKPYILDLPGCPTPCPLPLFIQLTKSVVPQDWYAECQNPQEGTGKASSHLPHHLHSHSFWSYPPPHTKRAPAYMLLLNSACRTHCYSTGCDSRSAEHSINWSWHPVLEEKMRWA